MVRALTFATLLLCASCQRLSSHCGGPCPDLATAEEKQITAAQSFFLRGEACFGFVERSCEGGIHALVKGDGFVSSTEYFDEKGTMFAAEWHSDDGNFRKYGFPPKCRVLSTTELCEVAARRLRQTGGLLVSHEGRFLVVDGVVATRGKYGFRVELDGGQHTVELDGTLFGVLDAPEDLRLTSWRILDAGTGASTRFCGPERTLGAGDVLSLNRANCLIDLAGRTRVDVRWVPRAEVLDAGVR